MRTVEEFISVTGSAAQIADICCMVPSLQEGKKELLRLLANLGGSGELHCAHNLTSACPGVRFEKDGDFLLLISHRMQLIFLRTNAEISVMIPNYHNHRTSAEAMMHRCVEIESSSIQIRVKKKGRRLQIIDPRSLLETATSI